MNFTCKRQECTSHWGMWVPDCLSSVMRQSNKTKTSTDKPGPNYMIVPKLESHKKGAAAAAAVNYLSCCMKIEKKSVWLSCSLAWLSLAWVGNLPILHGFLNSKFLFFPTVKTHPVLIPWSPRCKVHLPAAQLCPTPTPWDGELHRDLSWLRPGKGRAKPDVIPACHYPPQKNVYCSEKSDSDELKSV